MISFSVGSDTGFTPIGRFVNPSLITQVFFMELPNGNLYVTLGAGWVSIPGLYRMWRSITAMQSLSTPSGSTPPILTQAWNSRIEGDIAISLLPPSSTKGAGRTTQSLLEAKTIFLASKNDPTYPAKPSLPSWFADAISTKSWLFRREPYLDRKAPTLFCMSQFSIRMIFNPNPHCWVAKSSTFRQT
jgi:hypothetical protein